MSTKWGHYRFVNPIQIHQYWCDALIWNLKNTSMNHFHWLSQKKGTSSTFVHYWLAFAATYWIPGFPEMLWNSPATVTYADFVIRAQTQHPLWFNSSFWSWPNATTSCGHYGNGPWSGDARLQFLYDTWIQFPPNLFCMLTKRRYKLIACTYKRLSLGRAVISSFGGAAQRLRYVLDSS